MLDKARILCYHDVMIRIGNGYDVHKLVQGRKLILGGVEIEHEQGLDGHSDADVLAHAVADALLGAAALGDIGQHFPPGDPDYAGADSCGLLARVAALLRERGWEVGNVDTVIVAEKPKLSAYLPQMRANIARACRTAPENISVKATTEEGLGLAGAGIGAHCVCTIVKSQGVVIL
jgi:2-C-methyl-D-erythritol 2,4-cyclodiphosphate synthase